MKKKNTRADYIINTIVKLLQEFQVAKIHPNVLMLTYADYEIAKQSYPYLFSGDSFYYNNQSLELITVAQKDVIGVSLCFHTTFAKELNESPQP